jgi:hypothetical protein
MISTLAATTRSRRPIIKPGRPATCGSTSTSSLTFVAWAWPCWLCAWAFLLHVLFLGASSSAEARLLLADDLVVVGGGLAAAAGDFDYYMYPDVNTPLKASVDYVASFLESFGCDLDAAIAYQGSKVRTRVYSLTSTRRGGFGVQMCSLWIPKTISGMFFGARLRLSFENWNYGCPNYENPHDILLHAYPKNENDEVVRVTGSNSFTEVKNDIVTNNNTILPFPIKCNGRNVSLFSLRSAAANFWFQFQPPIAALIDKEVRSLKLPSSFLAVHIRGGDKFEKEWTGDFRILANPKYWAEQIDLLLSHESQLLTAAASPPQTRQIVREHIISSIKARPTAGVKHSNISSNVIFGESDDCRLLLAVKKELTNYGIEMKHMPCATTEEPAESTYRPKVSGHNQNSWNMRRSCDELIRYFSALTIFRDAQSVLLGSGGTKGIPLPPYGWATSNTALFVETLRHGIDAKRHERKTYCLFENGKMKMSSNLTT